ncbi:hypothetical protein B0H11DRAFT_1927937 [Mycena galericulata]|nr:hypothetical protein B0H11DRAFT_1927937 [Mycena galericulata]
MAVIYIQTMRDCMDFGPYVYRTPPTAYFTPKISENGPVLDEVYLFVRVVGLSGAAAGDSMVQRYKKWMTRMVKPAMKIATGYAGNGGENKSTIAWMSGLLLYRRAIAEIENKELESVPPPVLAGRPPAASNAPQVQGKAKIYMNWEQDSSVSGL